MAASDGAGTSPLQLDRTAFKETLSLMALRVQPRQCQALMKKLTGYTFDRPRTRCIVPDAEQASSRLLLLSEAVTDTELTGLPGGLRDLVASLQLPVVTYAYTLEYSVWPVDAVLRRVLPPGVEVPSSFESIGHIAHLNLREELLPYKHIIGQVILDKNPHLRTVVNKVGNIESEFRVFEMEVVAGEPRLETEVQQHRARFRLNYSQVYWNSRLEAEHARLVALLRPGQVLADVMAGIGPFAIPAAQRGLTVWANDLNPRSYHYLCQNIRLNKVADKVHPVNMDGRAFIRCLAGSAERDSLAAGAGHLSPAATAPPPAASSAQNDTSCSRPTTPPAGVHFDHAVMNLPSAAVEFLDAFHGAFAPERWRGRQLPLVHCYTFSRAAEQNAEVQARVETALGGPLDEPPTIHQVRDVAPNKRMLCVSFRVPASIAFASRLQQEAGAAAFTQAEGDKARCWPEDAKQQNGVACSEHGAKKRKAEQEPL